MNRLMQARSTTHQAEWVFYEERRILVVQAYGDLTIDTVREGRKRIADQVRGSRCSRVLVDMRRAVVLLSPKELGTVTGEVMEARYAQPVGLLVRECDQTLAFRHAVMMAVKGMVRLWWTDPYDALEWTGLTALPPFREPRLAPAALCEED
jgi:hypothetical protein